jgi:hypothetical protein
MKTFISIILLFSLQGCVSVAELDAISKDIYNIPSSGKSQFDDTKYISMKSMYCSNITLKLYQDSPQHTNGVVLLSAGTRSIVNLNKTLHLKIDGKKSTFKSNDLTTQYDHEYSKYGNYSFSHRKYIVPESLINEISDANEVFARISTSNNEYIDGKCSSLTLAEYNEANKGMPYALEATPELLDSVNSHSAQNGFRNFLHMMNTTIW